MEKLQYLTPPELIFVQKHLELGNDHLLDVLGKKGFQGLLQFIRPNPKTIDKAKPDDTEASGNLILAVNTIITGCFGGWLGLSAMMGLNLNSPVTFGTVFTLAAVVSATIGYQSFRFTKQEATKTIQTLQILQFEREILKEIRNKRERELHEIQEDLCAVVISLSPVKAKVSITNWITSFSGVLREKISSYQNTPAYPFLKREIADIQVRMKKNFEEGNSDKEGIHPSDEERQKKLPSVLESLIRSYPQASKAPKSWVRRNSRLIFISLVPTLFGGFGSLFVYLSGSTDIARAFGCNNLLPILTSPQAKLVKIGIAVLLTLYFGFSSLYSNRKAHKRSVEIEKEKEKIVKEETALTLLDEQLFKFRQAREDAEKIREMLCIAEKK